MALRTEFRGENRHSDRFLPAGTYPTVPLGDIYQRQQEFSALWPRIIRPIANFRVGNILEIGPGVGGETRAFQSFYPEAHITAVDIDERAELAAEQNGVDVISLDLAADRTPDRLQRLVNGRAINTVIALRTSGGVADNLLKWWDQNSTQTLLVFSLMWASDASFSAEINKRAIDKGASQIDLASHGRLYDESVMTLIH